jgi:hypothetical protein
MINSNRFDKFTLMITVLAYQSFDGSGVYEYEGQLYFIEPPYTSMQSRQITPAQLHYLSRQLDYDLVNVPCSGFPEVKDYLITLSKTWTNPHGNAVVDEATLIKGLATLSEEDLADVISNLHSDLLGKGKFQETKVALDRLWKVGKVTSSTMLRDAMRSIEAEVAPKMAGLAVIKSSPAPDVFKHVTERYPDLALQGKLYNPVAA